MNQAITPAAFLNTEQAQENTPIARRSGHSLSREFEEIFTRAVSQARTDPESNGRDLVKLGSLSRENPTVSHLLMQDPEYGEQCWDIVHDPVNRGKPFRDLSSGETVWLDPRNNEVLVGAEASKDRSESDPSSASGLFRPGSTDGIPHSGNPTHSLSQAVSSYVGTPYERLDCYELVVQGLKDLGINYSGEQGLQSQLMQKARLDEGDPNAYLTGEGLISSLGTQVHQERITPDSAAQQSAQGMLNSLDQRLEPGMILSFSTPEGGHTGVISRKDGEWTFVNSGRIQHAVEGIEVRRGVAEEKLDSELDHWIKEAREKGHDLTINVGRLSSDKMSRFLQPSRTFSASI